MDGLSMDNLDETDYIIYANGLCGPDDPFFNLSLTWNTSDPDVTACFRKTTLIWTPCAVFWFGMLFYIKRILWSPPQHRRSSISAVTIAKTLFASTLTAIAVIDLIYWAISKDKYPVDLIDPALRCLTFGFVVGLIQAERTRGFRISPLQFLFLGSYLFLGILNTYSNIRGYFHDLPNDLFSFVTFLLTMVFVLASFICHFFVEPIPSYHAAQESMPSTVETFDAVVGEKNTCPLIDASFPSLLTFSWISGFMWTGFKRPLTTEDLWELPSSARSSTIVPNFLRFWEPRVKAVKIHNTKIDAQEPSKEVKFDKTNDEVEVKIVPGSASSKKKTVSRSHQNLLISSLMLKKLVMGFNFN